MGSGKFWKRGSSEATRVEPAFGAAEFAGAENALWDWFEAGLAWTLFTLPEHGILILADEQGTGRFVQFSKGGGLRAEVGAFGGTPERDSVLAERRWSRPDEDEINWYQDLTWPAYYADYERVAESVAWALRNVLDVWLPLGLRSTTWNDGRGPEPDIGEIPAYELPADRLRAMEPAALHELAEVGQHKLAQTKLIGQSNHAMKTIIAEAVCRSEGWELLVGGGDLWPTRDRTVDFIALAGPDRLVAVDVILDVQDFDDIPLDEIVIDGKRVQRGTSIFVKAMIHADPDLRNALTTGALATFHDGPFRTDYRLVAVNSEREVRSFGVSDVPGSTVPGSEPAPTNATENRYPLLKPADWPHRALARHWMTGPGSAPIAVLATDEDGQYAIEVDFPEATDLEAVWSSAIGNLAALNYDWEVAEIATVPFANCSGHEFSAEKVLDPNALRTAHRFLKSTRMWVSVPRRTCLMAVPADLNPAQTVVFTALVQRTFEDDSYGHAPITRGIYLVENGHIIDFVESPESLRPPSARP